MSNKICGGCKYHNPISGICIKLGKKPSKTLPSCPYRPTNGDRIRQGGNRDFAEYFVHETGAVFASTLIVDKTFDTYEEATTATEDYLNAPAESED